MQTLPARSLHRHALSLLVLAILGIGLIAGVVLTQQEQDVREYAAVSSYPPPPVARVTPYHLGLFYMPKPPSPTHQWYFLTAVNREPQYRRQGRVRYPQLGLYSGDDVEAMDWQITWAVESGINFFVFDEFWIASQDTPVYSGAPTFLRTRYKNTMQFAVSLDQINTAANTPEEVRQTATNTIARYYKEHYFNQSNYLRIGGKPAVYLLNPFVIYGGERGRLSDTEIARQFMRAFEQAAGTDIYWILAHSPNMDWADRVGIPAVHSRYVSPGITHKLELGDPQSGIAYVQYVTEAVEINRQLYGQAQASGIAYVPSITTNFDERVRYSVKQNHLRRSFSTNLSLSQLERLMRDTRQIVDTFNTANPAAVLRVDGKPVVGLGAWNEWAEDAQFEPGISAINQSDPFGPLNLVASVFSGQPAPSRIVPSRDFTPTPPTGKASWDFNSSTDRALWYNSILMSAISVDASGEFGTTTAQQSGSLTLAADVDLSQFDGFELTFRAQCAQNPCTDRIVINWISSTYPQALDPQNLNPAGELISGLTASVLAADQCSDTSDSDWITCRFRIAPNRQSSWRGRVEYINLKFNTTQNPVRYDVKQFVLVSSTPTPSPSFTPTPSLSPSLTPMATPRPTPTLTLTPTPTPSPSPSPTPSPTPSPAPQTHNLVFRIALGSTLGASRQAAVVISSVSFRAPDILRTVVLNQQTTGALNEYVGTIEDLVTGSYTIFIKPAGYLRARMPDVTVGADTTADWTGELFIAGDFNDDNRLTIADIALLLSQYTALSVPVTPATDQFDVTGDSRITIADIALVLSNYTQLVVAGE